MKNDSVDGSCYCGAIRFTLTFPSRFCAHCHCPNCRRAHGAAFVTYAGFKKDQMRLTGQELLTRHVTETGATRSFCSRCGSTLFYEGPRWEGEVHVALANIGGPIDRAPDAHVYADHRAEWYEIHDSLEQYGGPSGTDKRSAS